MNNLSIQQVAERTNVHYATVLQWIKRGWLTATKIGDNRSHRWIIHEDDFETFLRSDHYRGDPDEIGNSEAFNRVPLAENCYPFNLIRAVLEIRDESEDFPVIDIWDVNVREFKKYITQMTDLEQRVIELRFQFGLTLDEAAGIMAKTRERIRQIQVKALRKLRHAVYKGYFRTVPKADYLELESKAKGMEITIAELSSRLEKYEKRVTDDNIVVIAPSEYQLHELGLSVRSYNCLKRAGIDTLQEIIDFDKNQEGSGSNASRTWFGIRNLGVASLREIATAVYEKCGYRLRKYDQHLGQYVSDLPLGEYQ